MSFNEYNLNQILNSEPEINTENIYNEEFFITIDAILDEFDDILEEISSN